MIYCAGPSFYGKVRPAVIVQSDKYNQEPPSFTVCLLTGEIAPDSAIRVTVNPSKANGLDKSSQVMIDKVMSLPADRIKNRIGSLTDRQMRLVDDAMRDWLNL